MQLSESQGCLLVRLDLHACDQTDVGRMNGGNRADIGHEGVMEQVRVGGHFHDDGIGGLKMLGAPGFELVVGNFVGTEDSLLFGIDTHGHKIGLVDVQPDPTLNVGRLCHKDLLSEENP